MRILNLLLCALISAFLASPALATECANAGTAPLVAPDDTGDSEATACGNAAVAGGAASIAVGYTASSVGAGSAALGFNASSNGLSSTALGYFASSLGSNSTALGYQASTTGDFSVALGHQASTTGETSMALGYGALSTGTDSTALGRSASSAGLASTALGYDASSSGANSTALGYLAFANQPDTVILGSIAGVNTATVYANIGIGTTAPVEAVDVERSAAAARFQLSSFTDISSEAPQFIQRRARGTRLAPTAVQGNDNLGLFSFRGYNGTSMGGSRATITAQAAGTFSASSTPTRLIFSTTPVGQTTPQSVLVITPDGKVQVKGVNLNVPDYVFEDDYALMPLDELKTFIDKNGHLPGIASAQQVNEEGLDLAGSQMGQLQKIEELTLYTLQQQELLVAQREHLKTQDSRLEAQKAHVQAQQERIDHLEAQLNRVLAALD